MYIHRLAGMAMTHAVFSGTSIIVSYVWGVCVFGNQPQSIGLSITGLFILITSLCMISVVNDLTNLLDSVYEYCFGSNGVNSVSKDREADGISLVLHSNIELSDQSSPKMNRKISSSASRKDERSTRMTVHDREYLLGLASAVICGIVGGTTLVPYHYVDDHQKGLVYLPSFGTAALSTSIFILLGYFYSSDIAISTESLYVFQKNVSYCCIYIFDGFVMQSL